MIFELDTNEFGETYVKRLNADGTTSWIPASEENRDYREYLRYTAWVEAGNTPEDFWTQDDELIEPSEPKEKEETTEGES